MAAVLAPLLGFALAQSLPPSGAVPSGMVLLQGQPLDRVQLQQITYVGDCPGEEQPELRGLSFLAAVPPAPFQRITIQNLATGGFTDREYDERRRSSEAFSIALGQGQKGSYLTVAPGTNTFNYQVRNRVQNIGLGQGTASLQVSVNRISQNRRFSEVREDRYCSGEKYGRRTGLDACPNGLISLERIGVCPGGKTTTLSLETVGNAPAPGSGGSWGGGGYRPPAGNGGWGGGGSGSGNGWGGNSWGGGGGGGGNWTPRY